MSRLLNILLAVLLLATPLAAQDGRSLHWSDISVAAHLDADGRLRIRERQGMVFDGAWNGGERRFDLRHGQQLELHGIVRIDRASGERIPLTRSEPDQVDEYDWADGNLVRWRSRADSDPPFRDQELVYELDYSVWPVLIPMEDGEYELRHDFAFADRAGVIERFQVDLTLDEAWSTAFGNHIQETAAQLEPGRGYVLTVPIARVEGKPALAAGAGAPGLVRAGIAAGALAVPLFVLLGLRRRDRELDAVAPLVPHEEIDVAWLEREVFARPAEIVGTAWDRAVGGAEVSALLARLVGEGKLSSRVEEEKGEPVLHLRRLAPLLSFPEHERELLQGLFFDGGEETDTSTIAEHYKKQGFDPAGIIRKPLLKRLEALPGEAGRRRPWKRWLLLIVAGAALALLAPDGPGRIPVAVVGILIAGVAMLMIPAVSDALGKRVTARGGLLTAVVVLVAIPALLLVAVALLRHSVDGPFGFYRPGTGLLIGFLVMVVGIGGFALAMATPTETVPRLAYRRRLVSAREYFRRELESPDPRLRDAWFPYLLAFGLDDDVSRWFETHARSERTSGIAAATLAGATHGSSSSSGTGWTGGGPQFGGGTFAGGGAGGAWGMAAAGMAAGVAAPGSTGGGGGGVAASGGGGGGGW